MPGPAVVIVPTGGIPVTPVTSGAPAVTVANAGIAVTIKPNSTPFIIEGYTP